MNFSELRIAWSNYREKASPLKEPKNNIVTAKVMADHKATSDQAICL